MQSDPILVTVTSNEAVNATTLQSLLEDAESTYALRTPKHTITVRAY